VNRPETLSGKSSPCGALLQPAVVVTFGLYRVDRSFGESVTLSFSKVTAYLKAGLIGFREVKNPGAKA